MLKSKKSKPSIKPSQEAVGLAEPNSAAHTSGPMKYFITWAVSGVDLSLTSLLMEIRGRHQLQTLLRCML